MLSIRVLAERIADQVPQLATVTGLAELVASKGIVKRKPACFIAPGSETAQPNPLLGRTSQRVAETFGLWIALDNGADATGLKRQDELKALADQVRAALVGWQPGPEYLPIELVSAGPIQWDDGQTLFWPEQYRTEYYQES